MRTPRRIIICFVLALLSIFIFIFLTTDHRPKKNEQPLYGYASILFEEEDDDDRDWPSVGNNKMIDLTDSLDKPQEFQERFGDEVIFFIETSEKGRMNVRQVCTIEAVCLHNPHAHVFVVFPYPVKEIDMERSPALVDLVAGKNNVHLVTVSSDEVVRGTPLEEVFETKLRLSPTPKEHLSDLLRLGLLWKLGGVYMDLDLITFKSVEPLARLRNFVTADGVDQVNTAMCGFQAKHPFLKKIMQDVRDTYDPNVYSTVPFAFNAAIRAYFHMSVDEAIKRRKLSDMYILDQSVISPVTYVNFTTLLDHRMANLTDKIVENSYGAHLWGSLTTKYRLRIGSKSPYATIARRFCPNALNYATKYF
ncbi:lactosylceramide 4-alpha-galactosyltransferase-like [Cloeon dipterum]|uniref:lactosylceramide 4-alpha-galactosyltransferase-like n=1 Tax=Cloeon dipterum TaxID=197152 RepID=UPI00321FBF38